MNWCLARVSPVAGACDSTVPRCDENRVGRLMLLWFVAGIIASCSPSSNQSASQAASSHGAAILDLKGQEVDPLREAGSNTVVFIFVRPDCPISNRYAPEIRRLHEQFTNVSFRLVYADADVSASEIQRHIKEYNLPPAALRDPSHYLVKLCAARVTPEAAVFQRGRLVYHGRIDDRYADLGSDHGKAARHDLEEVLDAIASDRPVTTLSAPAVGCAIPTR